MRRACHGGTRRCRVGQPYAPVVAAVAGAATVVLPAGVPVVSMAAGSHVLAIGSNGKLYSWGNNSNGQLGDGSVKSRATPVAVKVPAKYRVFGVAAGQYRSVALVE
jgi:alpha-tubulin suppressor-like RCC1 family protein